MGKIIEKIKIASFFDPTKSLEIDAVVDTGATMLVLPKNIVEELGLKKIEEVKVKYADGRVEKKEVYGAVKLELKGRVGIFDVLAENEGSQALIGQIVLERLDLIIEPSTKKLIPNPRSPEMPMIEIFSLSLFFPFLFLYFFSFFLAPSFSFADPKQIFIEQRCVKCHSIKSEDIKPLEESLLEDRKIKDQSDVGLRRDKDWIKKWLKKEITNEKGKKHNIKWKGDEKDLDELAEWLSQLRTKIPEQELQLWYESLKNQIKKR